MQFEQNQKEIPGIPAIGKENSEEFIRLSQDNNYAPATAALPSRLSDEQVRKMI